MPLEPADEFERCPIVEAPEDDHLPSTAQLRLYLQETMEEALNGEEPMPKVSSLPWLKKLLLMYNICAHLNFRDLRKILKLPTTGPDPQCLHCASCKMKR